MTGPAWETSYERKLTTDAGNNILLYLKARAEKILDERGTSQELKEADAQIPTQRIARAWGILKNRVKKECRSKRDHGNLKKTHIID